MNNNQGLYLDACFGGESYMRFQKYPELFKLRQPSLRKFKSFINYFNLNLEYFKSMGINSIDNKGIIRFLIPELDKGITASLYTQPVNLILRTYQKINVIWLKTYQIWRIYTISYVSERNVVRQEKTLQQI
jgi:hypothetical protein